MDYLRKHIEENTDANTILLFEGYTDELAIAKHRASEHFQSRVLGEIIPLLENREVTLATQLMQKQP